MTERTHTSSEASPPRRAAAAAARAGVLRHSVAWFLGALVLLIVTAPFVDELKGGRHLDAALITVVLITAVLAVGGRRRALALAMVFAAPVLAGGWIYHLRPEDAFYKFFIATFFLFVGFVLFHLLRFILRSPQVNSEVLCAAVSGYLLLALLWAAAYALTARIDPASFSGGEAGQPLQGFTVLYFSVMTLATVGYGDIAPVSGVARMLAVVEAITGTMYVTVLIARLVALYSLPGSPGETGAQTLSADGRHGSDPISADHNKPTNNH